MKIKIYADGAEKESILKLSKDPNISGFTTNPSLMKKAGITDYPGFAKEILTALPDKPISFEVFADDLEEMHRQALKIHDWRKHAQEKYNPVYVKIPITTTNGTSTLPLIQKLTKVGIQLNVTALLTLEQVAETCASLKGGAPSIVSVFAGRIADTGRDPIPLMRKSVELARAAGKDVELLWASTREILNVVQAEECGCDIITVPPDIFSKLSMFGKDLKELSLDTVKMFRKDALAAGFTL